MKTLTKGFFSLLALAFCGIPLWVWLGFHSLTNPQGFWQEFAVGVLGIWVLGGLQILGLFIFIVALVSIWED